jgi:hypothetical protein
VSTLIIAVLLCVASAAGYAAAAVLQERVAERPLGTLVRMPVWWAALALNGVAGLLHVVALRYGPLSLVQPFGVLTLVLAVPVGAVIARRAVTRVEWRGMALTVAGLAGILVLAGTTGDIAVLSTAQLVGLLLVTAAVLTALGGWSAVPGASGLWAAAAAGVAFGVSSALTQTVTVHLTDGGLGALLSPAVLVPALAMAVLAVAGVLFTQRSYRAGLGAPLAVSTLANPVAAASIGLVLLGEQISGGALGTLIAAASAIAAAVGVSLLIRTQEAPAAPAPHREPAPAESAPIGSVLAGSASAVRVETALPARSESAPAPSGSAGPAGTALTAPVALAVPVVPGAVAEVLRAEIAPAERAPAGNVPAAEAEEAWAAFARFAQPCPG